MSHSLVDSHPPGRSGSGHHTSLRERTGLVDVHHSLFAELSCQVIIMARAALSCSSSGNVRLTSEHRSRHGSSGHGSCQHVIACCRSPVT